MCIRDSRQRDPGDAMYLVRLGFVKVSQSFPGGDLVLAYHGRGEFFGEMGLIGEEQRTATCTAVDRCDPRRAYRAESSGRVAVPDRLPAVTGETGGERGGRREPPPGLEAQRTGLVIRPKNGDLGRSASFQGSPYLTGAHTPIQHEKGCRNRAIPLLCSSLSSPSEVIDGIEKTSVRSPSLRCTNRAIASRAAKAH